MWLRLVPLALFPLACILRPASAYSATGGAASQRVGFSWASTGRSTSELLQTCVITLLSCTWTVIHLNIPAPHDGFWALFKRKLKWMVITLLAPEVTCSVALRQWGESRSVVREMKELGVHWTTAHSFYAAMGGYVLHHGDTTIPLLPSEIISLLKNNNNRKEGTELFQLPPVEGRDIEDRSKASGFTKFFTLVQTGWLVTQCIVRGVGGLPISQLEIATVAFATCTIAASGFWWNKPLDVGRATLVKYDGDIPDSLSSSKGWRDREARKRVKMTTRIVVRGSQKSMFFHLVLPLFLFSTVFSTMHLAAWNFNFATSKERVMWRISSLTAALVPLAIAASLQVASIWDPSTHTDDAHDRISAPELAAAVILCYFMSVLAYLAARLVLIFQVFYCLRSMPVGIYASVAWINYFPHL